MGPARQKNCSLSWRQRLEAAGDDTVARQALAKSLLATRLISDECNAFIQSADAIYVICKKDSGVRIAGDGVAHPSSQSPSDLRRLLAVVGSLPADEQKGMAAIINIFTGQKSVVL